MLTTADRVKRHRTSRKLIRVEVEVPTQVDALAVRRFAQERRRQAQGQGSTLTGVITAHPNDAVPLEELISVLTNDARGAIRLFADALAAAKTPTLLARGLRIATNFREVALRNAQIPDLE